MEPIRVAMETPAGKPDEKLPVPHAPMFVAVDVPFNLIHMAKTYPALDWNEVMRHAVESYKAIPRRGPIPIIEQEGK